MVAMQRLTSRAVVSLAIGLTLLGSAARVQARVEARADASRRVSAPHVSVELIAGTEGPGPGGTLWLGLRFELEPQWHIYWQNPGDSGGPPQVVWKLTQGLKAGAFEWPAPQRIDSDGIVSYGYRGVVVLPVPISSSARAGAGAGASIAASVKWLICKDMCLPGQAQLELRLPLTGEERGMLAGWQAEVRDARAKVPRRAPAGWSAKAKSSPDAFQIDVLAGEHLATGVFFPVDPGQMEESVPQAVEPIPGGLRFKLRRSPQLAKDPTALRGVVSLPGGRAFIVTVPVISSPGGKKGSAP